MQFFYVLSLVSATSFVLAHDSHRVEKRLPETWHHPRGHPVHQLFRRASQVDGHQFLEVGSEEWKKEYPAGSPNPNDVPVEWSKALDAAIANGKIPKIPSTTQKDGGSPTYPDGTDPSSPEVCSSTYKCRAPGTIWDGPSGYFGISFDDGPLPFSDPLLDFLKKKGEKATHFMIGQNILQNPQQFKKTFEQGHDLAVHTYSHKAMTTLSNKDILAELGWTMQIIHDSTGGRVPKYWRPAYGDSDTRVQAIAKEIFGLKTVIWNQDTNDWGIAEGSHKKVDVTRDMMRFLKTSKKTGLVVLEHESSKQAVDIFINSFDAIKRNGWKTRSLAKLLGGNNAYQNVNGDKVNPDDRFLGDDEKENDDEPAEENPPVTEEPEEPAEPAPAEEDNEDDGEADDDEGEPEILPTSASSSDEPEETSSDSDTSSSDSSSDSESTSTDDESSASDSEDSSKSTDDESSSSSDEEGTTTTDDSETEEKDKKQKDKKNSALSRVSGGISGSFLIALCIAPAALIVLG